MRKMVGLFLLLAGVGGCVIWFGPLVTHSQPVPATDSFVRSVPGIGLAVLGVLGAIMLFAKEKVGT